ncbi:sugar phosphate isomerase/epimerase family protein [Pedobacter heparinus]|uniref:Xylose isomerase domain protein TIM barrel n=1 Tax=Pedobacter heparinus (strain ATCC 13125 / DSM 2366 / CIP 104194 / JCM 7457 / NBRC 12017 / NCIMB 9290 / NRRL B-14731 / HIM 762-3) TaxID=485917 RepID=C6XU51_PEDHD|nr:sugar phosphate isomerase/epimerase [Pedobacter heparinus]ACU05844.1 Xylose isomerase domain protein TIM barrel [Pedobacter heparinus DSM 2366]
MNSRRTFIKHAGLAAAGAVLLPSFACSGAAAEQKVGLQLYTLREQIPHDVKGVIEKIAQAGYKEVETFGYSANAGYWGQDPKSFKDLLKANGLTSPSGHFVIDDFITSGNKELLKPLIEGAAAINNQYFTVAHIAEPIRKTLDDYKKITARLNEAAELVAQSGLKLAYHNHAFEFDKHEGGSTGYEIMLNGTDKNLIRFEMDLYWVVRSGNDPVALFNKYPGRFVMWHVKDMDKANHAINTEVGTGTIDFKNIYKHAKQAGLEHLIVEQENFSKDPYVSIKQSFDYVNQKLI